MAVEGIFLFASDLVAPYLAYRSGSDLLMRQQKESPEPDSSGFDQAKFLESIKSSTRLYI